MKLLSVTGIIVLSLFFSLTANAAFVYTPEVQPVTDDGNVHHNLFKGFYRFTYDQVSDFDIDAEGDASLGTENTNRPIRHWGEHRWRLAPSLNYGKLKINFEVDLLADQAFSDYENLAPGYDRFDRRDRGNLYNAEIRFREAYVQYLTPIGLLKIGHTTSKYGLGMIANDGREEDNRWGSKHYGDVVERIMFATTPFASLGKKGSWAEYLTILLSADLVYWDENADLLDEDIAINASFGLMYRDPKYTNGIIFTYRWQEDSDDDYLKVYAINLNGKNKFEFAPGKTDSQPGFEMVLHFNYEFVTMLGKTNRFQQLGAEDGLNLKAFGAVGQVVLEMSNIGLDIDFEVGYASGDNNPYDDESTGFYFDQDFNVGMIFYDEILPMVTAKSVEILTDPDRTTSIPKGLDLIPSKGRVTNSLYFMPQLRYKTPLGMKLDETLQLSLGAAVLTTPTKFAHAYYTFENGGTPTNHLGGRTNSNYLGTEILAGVLFKFWPFKQHIGTKLGFQFAYFMPGSALEDATGEMPDAVWKIMTSATLQWQ